jgi:hypothetical protein
MNKVQITPNAQTGALITPFNSNPDYSYLQLQSVEMIQRDGGWLEEKRRSALLRAKTSVLESFVAQHGKTLTLPGRIVVREFLEDELPENYASRLNKNLSYEQAVQPFLKRAGKDGVALTSNGQRILRFSDYDASGTQADISVAHDNVSEVAEFRAAVNANSAKLPA